ncbi:hypothetical protein F9C07_1734002 [Aspergillus flavus]|uniref:Uncharacterized protein n=1 Tax=Aspergillus flavus (strain ATCC 200026 / FGSC A1120 / IAM 13836 / NRRL 3357 / JCM 12722 / SRRC 167) TaxID=332952 RepID=A0A7U2N177_ASPFN|nr:hypothetical protein AFLA_008613 [Aspergillus flavus NRRL3357]QRD93653.1 hypothetical protein F9C07_1734002 [Aspergillus flavus]
MALPLHIPPFIHNPSHKHHLPPQDHPLRIQIEGPLIAIQRLLPHTPWHLNLQSQTFPQPAGPKLVRLTYRQLYGRDPRQKVPGDLEVRDEYLGWMPEKYLNEQTDYYDVTFDHLVPADDPYPEVLQVNIIEIEDDNRVYANTWLLFAVDPADFIGKKVLAVPRCCQKRKGTKDRWRINALVDQRVNGGEQLKSAEELER